LGVWLAKARTAERPSRREAIQEGQRLDVPGHSASYGAKKKEHRAAAEVEHKAGLLGGDGAW